MWMYSPSVILFHPHPQFLRVCSVSFHSSTTYVHPGWPFFHPTSCRVLGLFHFKVFIVDCGCFCMGIVMGLSAVFPWFSPVFLGLQVPPFTDGSCCIVENVMVVGQWTGTSPTLGFLSGVKYTQRICVTKIHDSLLRRLSNAFFAAHWLVYLEHHILQKECINYHSSKFCLELSHLCLLFEVH